MIKIYLASSWFTENTEKSLTTLENILRSNKNVNPYFPRHDGIKLSSNEFHDHELRKKVFLENVVNIMKSDYLLVNLDGSDGFYDTGTCWELGYAMAHNIPVIIYDPTDNLNKYFKGLLGGFHAVYSTPESLEIALNNILSEKNIPKKLLFVGPDDTQAQRDRNADILSTVILESHGDNFKWVDSSHGELCNNIEDVFKDVDYMVAVIDDRHPIVSWMMGQAYERNIPIISFTNFDYGVNIMLGISVLTHCKGNEELKSTLQKLKREGFKGFSEYNTNNLKAY